MKKLLQAGFTMIELLVVIAIIGVLAAAVLAAINPVEQINKGRDTRLRSDAAELNNAMERYYAVQEMWPWNDSCLDGGTAPCTYTCVDAGIGDGCGEDDAEVEMQFDGITAGDVVADSWMWLLDETEEVKPNFVDRMEDDQTRFYLFKGDGAGVIYVCFSPTSRQFRAEAASRCTDEADTLPTDAESTAFDPYTAICPLPTDIDGGNLICIP